MACRVATAYSLGAKLGAISKKMATTHRVLPTMSMGWGLCVGKSGFNGGAERGGGAH